tara:strand:+ start:316 stop:474 length:159 start_codon:yes stop_codon:yes gene_type:complete
MYMISYLLAMFVVSVGFLSYGYVKNDLELSDDYFPLIDESDFIDLNPFRDWK